MHLVSSLFQLPYFHGKTFHIAFLRLLKEGVRNIGRAVEMMAEAEQLDAHKNAMTVRINSLK